MDVDSATRWTMAAEVAREQHGRVTLAQLRGVGIERGSVEKAVRSGRLHRVHAGVFAVGHRAPTLDGDRMAAVLRCGAAAALSHRAAAGVHELRAVDAWPIDVTSPSGRGRGVRGIRVHRAPLPPGDRVVVDGLLVTSVARTIADLAHDLGESDLRRVVREAQYRRVFELHAVLRAAARRPNRLLIEILDDLAPTESSLEDLFRARILRPFKLPEPVCRQRLLGARADFRWPDARLIVEVDGSHHANPLTHQADVARDNALQLAGELVLRYTKTGPHPPRTPHGRSDRRRAARPWRLRHLMDAAGVLRRVTAGCSRACASGRARAW